MLAKVVVVGVRRIVARGVRCMNETTYSCNTKWLNV
jgi:hypothetical protein